ncbi:MAG TPA: BREX system serine/threonine kinase PglW [Actinocrinis sp.]|uniref:BREX system serine/threonine kinase PglW n=1 Tax=Actinocrinis sp. TaxID=1920516 RepID=UPI002DDCF2AD|nr:BREX system serine/threonine kinase PglW [Actinocrinis sp.]HEV2345493.1 BREX system serine/threonine kinase PglW [Actinocrinis sp.]
MGGGFQDRLNRRWAQIGPSPYPWEQDGLDYVRGLMPDQPPHRAVTLFTFTAFSGRVSECDLFIAMPGGLYLIELKGHPGRLTNRGSDWTFHVLGSDRRARTLYLRNPLHSVDVKSKDLKDRLKRAASDLGLRITMPRIEPAVFLSDADLVSELDEGERPKVYGRDDRSTGLPGIWANLLSRPPARVGDRIDEEFTAHLPRLFDAIGVSAPQAHLKYGDDWRLAGKPLDQGPTWEDRLATRQGAIEETGRVRIYLTELEAEETTKTAVLRAAEREYYLLQGLRHRGVDEARDIKKHGSGPAILFRHDESDLRLDQFIAAFGDRLSFETRLGLVRQLAEALRYAHRHSLYHRALAARSVYVSARPDGSRPVLRIVDWQTAARDFSNGSAATRLRSLGRDEATDAHLRDESALYLAPEFNSEFPDPASMDVFGLGAVGYLLLTGQPPAATKGALLERLEAERGLHPAALVDGLDPGLDQLVYDATRHDVDDRIPDVDGFLALLKEVEAGRSRTAPSGYEAAAYVDPLEAGPGDWLGEDLCVKELLGTGGTGRALLVEKLTESDDGEAQVTEHVLKVALNHTDARDRLLAEAEALRKVGGGQIVRLLDGPRELGGHCVIDIQYAGDRSLARELREEGRLPYVRLKNLATNLFQALLVLERDEVLHRDIKPDNLGVYRIPRNDERELLLFDFSMAAARRSDITSGTSGYLDPFLGTRSRLRYDEHAERYAVAVTLHQMASGEKPVWGNGTSDPKSLDDEVPGIATELFSQPLREGLAGFFNLALHRDAERRFDSARQMFEAWNRVFIDAERATPPAPAGSEPRLTGSVQDLEAQRNQASEAAEPQTPLDAAGLSPAAIEVAHSLGAATVGELLGVAQYRINRARGAGTLAKRELNQRYRQWARKFRRPSAFTAAGAELTAEAGGAAAAPSGPDGVARQSDATTVATERLPVDAMAAALIHAVEATVRRRTGNKKVPAIRAYLSLPKEPTDTSATTPAPDVPVWTTQWPTQTDTARAVGLAQAASVNQYLSAAVQEWARLEWMARVRDELAEILAGQGRVMAVRELASELRARFGARIEDRGRALRYAFAVIRAALLVEAGENEPRYTESRRGAGVFVACESLPGSAVVHPAKDELIEYAVRLGQCADTAVLGEPLPGPKAVRGLLRAVREPDGPTASPLSDTRLVALTAAASRNALASPRADLYPRDLGLERALRISQAAAGVGYEPGVTVADLLVRVRVRFPELDFGDVTHIQLSEALEAAGYPLRFDYANQVFRGPERSVPQSTGLASGTAVAMAGAGAGAAGSSSGAVTEAAVKRLGEAVADGGFRALTVSVRHLPGLAAAIERRFPVLMSVNGNAEFLSCFRRLAAEQGQDWEKVLRVDGRLRVSGGRDAQSEAPRAYAEYVIEVAARLRAEWLERASPRERAVLLLYNAGLLARYWDIAGRGLLTGFQQSARRASETPHGLWLVCPAESARSSPTLDGRLVETVIPDGEWIVLGSAAVTELHSA